MKDKQMNGIYKVKPVGNLFSVGLAICWLFLNQTNRNESWSLYYFTCLPFMVCVKLISFDSFWTMGNGVLLSDSTFS